MEKSIIQRGYIIGYYIAAFLFAFYVADFSILHLSTVVLKTPQWLDWRFLGWKPGKLRSCILC